MATATPSRTPTTTTPPEPLGSSSSGRRRQRPAQGPVRLVVIGAGNRGEIYARYAIDRPDEARVVAVIDHPRGAHRARRLGRLHGLDRDRLFTASWPEEGHRVWSEIDAAIIAVPDEVHCEAVLRVLSLGIRYVLLEKPMGVSLEQCERIVTETGDRGACVAVCHVLRYTPLNVEIRRLIESGEIGDVLNVQHTEPVGHYHFAHSYVRGNWRRSYESAGSLLTKCCHDVDLICYWMAGVPGGGGAVESVSSFGSLRHFARRNKPAGAGGDEVVRCVDCPIEADCPYSARKIYLEPFLRRNVRGWPVSVVVADDGGLDDPGEISEETLTRALTDGPYGRCVYECGDNDVCDNQVVNFRFENGATASLTMISTTESVCQRNTKIYGSRAEVTADGATGEIRVYDFRHGKSRTVRPTMDSSETDGSASSLSGHGGADFHLMRAFVRAVQEDDPTLITTSAEESLRTHAVVFRAEESRLTGETLSW